jgi:hypothetical protein
MKSICNTETGKTENELKKVVTKWRGNADCSYGLDSVGSEWHGGVLSITVIVEDLLWRSIPGPFIITQKILLSICVRNYH